MNHKTKKYDLKKGTDFIGVTCVFYCHDGKGNLLLHKRSKNCRDEQDAWDCGGGSMEFGETFTETVKREIKEEYGTTPKNLHLCGIENVLRMNKGVQTHWIAVIFSAELNPKKVILGEPEKMDEVDWFPVNKLPKHLHSKLKTHLKVVQKSAHSI
jgi:8-oxo-dGTP diphosphatase